MKLSKRLSERRAAAERVKELQERIGQLRDAVTRTTPRYDADGGGSTGEDKMMAYMARLDRLETELTAASRRAYRISVETLEALNELPEEAYNVIVMRDFLGLSWPRIAKETGLTVTRCRWIRDRALGYRRKKGGR